MPHSTSFLRRRFTRAVGLATAGLLLAGAHAGAASAADGQIRGQHAANAIADNYIVVLKDDDMAKAKATQEINALASEHEATLKHRYLNAVQGFSAKMTEAEAQELAKDPNVAYVEQDRTVKALDTQTAPPSWGLDRIDQRDLPLNNAYTFSTTASNVTAYILDTGIRTSHSVFGGRASWGINTTGDGSNTDCHGHGTHVAGTVGGSSVGVAKGVKLVAVKVLDCAGRGSASGLIAGIDWVTAQHQPGQPAVANMSLGFPGTVVQAVDDAVTRSINDGVTYAIAAGNDNADACNTSPARTPAAITVGATNSTDARAYFSAYGSCLDLFAPGESITSASITSDTATTIKSGTSMASPHAAGAAALILAANPQATPQQVRDQLVDAATADKVTSPGTGSPNKLLYAAVSDGPWSGTGTATTTVTSDGTSGNPVLDYSVVGSSGSWTFSNTAKAARKQAISYRYKGYHAWFQVRVAIEQFVIRNGVETKQTLQSAGPVNCCAAPSGGFDYTGTATFDLQPGDTYGFRMSGSHFDSDRRLIGTLTLG